MEPQERAYKWEGILPSLSASILTHILSTLCQSQSTIQPHAQPLGASGEEGARASRTHRQRVRRRWVGKRRILSRALVTSCNLKAGVDAAIYQAGLPTDWIQ